ncbi:MAG: glycosyltransferase family 39 protein [Gemmatimonadetes bacterium]|nr:glycosyltransferase family 39 protein [Gemmatimonadota bacterium]
MKAIFSRRRESFVLLVLAIGAVLFRLLMFLGRGDYVAYDEGFYLLLGRNLWAGEGYTLTGLRHVALSPLFPVLAGAVDRVVGQPVWAGRIVAAVTGGLLILPCWSIFRRLGGRRAALLGCGLIAVMPSLAPFVVPYWIRWDLWVGAEPVLHLFLFSGIALSLRAFTSGRLLDWLLAGTAFALAYLARPEAIIPAVLLAATAGAILLRRRKVAQAGRLASFAVTFAAVALPYWLYLHDALGRWTLTGRGVRVELPAGAGTQGRQPGDPSVIIERMLWGDDETPYLRNLYSLAPSGTRLLSPYWGVAPADDAQVERKPEGGGRAEGAPGTAGLQGGGVIEGRPALRRLVFYGRALGIGVPWFLWPFIVAGLVARRRARDPRELLFAAPLVAASAAVAALIAVDPRTQLFLVPMLAYYAQRGLRLAVVGLERSTEQPLLRRGFLRGLVGAVAVVLLFGMDARRLYLSVTVGSPHHIVGAENRQVGEALSGWTEPGQPVMSWHPAVALYADRDWRVLPAASLPEIVRYAALNGIRMAVLSVYYPSPLPELPAHYLALELPDEPEYRTRWRFQPVGEAENLVVARLEPAP